MPEQVITIEHRKYAVGLFWQPVTIGQNPRNYARAIARAITGNFNEYVEYRYMVGIGSSKFGHKSGMGVAAAEVMEAFAEFSSFVAAFTVTGGFWIVAVRNGVILHDNLFDNEEAAKEYYKNLLKLPDWGAIIAPAAWDIPRSMEKYLDELMGTSHRYTLKALSNVRGNIIAIIALILLAVVVVYLFDNYAKIFVSPQTAKLDTALAEEYKRQIEEKNRRIAEEYEIEKTKDTGTAEQPAPVLKMPYDYLPVPRERADTCWRAIGFLMQPISGWTQLSAECGTEYATAALRRTHGTLADFYAIGEQILPGVNVREKSDSELTLTVKLPEISTHASLSESDSDSVMRDVYSIFQVMNAPASIVSDAEMIEQGDLSEVVNIVDIKADSKLVPGEFIKLFDGIDGVSIPFIKWDARAKQWNYEVKVYVK